MLAGVVPEPLDSLADHLERLRERVLGLGVSKRRDAAGEVERDEEREAQRGDDRYEEKESQEALAKRAEHQVSVSPASWPHAAPISTPWLYRTVTAGTRGLRYSAKRSIRSGEGRLNFPGPMGL